MGEGEEEEGRWGGWVRTGWLVGVGEGEYSRTEGPGGSWRETNGVDIVGGDDVADEEVRLEVSCQR